MGWNMGRWGSGVKWARSRQRDRTSSAFVPVLVVIAILVTWIERMKVAPSRSCCALWLYASRPPSSNTKLNYRQKTGAFDLHADSVA